MIFKQCVHIEDYVRRSFIYLHLGFLWPHLWEPILRYEQVEMSHGAKLPRKSSNPPGSDGSIGSSCFLPDECGHHWGKLNTQNRSPRGKRWKIPKPRIECRSGGDTNFGAQTGRATKVRASKKSQSRWKGTKFHRIAHHRFFDGQKLGFLGVWFLGRWAWASLFTSAVLKQHPQMHNNVV